MQELPYLNDPLYFLNSTAFSIFELKLKIIKVQSTKFKTISLGIVKMIQISTQLISVHGHPLDHEVHDISKYQPHKSRVTDKSNLFSQLV